MATTKQGDRKKRRSTARNRDRILRSSERFWRPSDLELATSTAQHLMTLLVRDGELRHVRKGLYWRGIKTALGMSPPPPSALISEIVGSDGVGPAGLSATNHLRLSTQIPRRSIIAVPSRAPSDTAAVTFVSRAARTGRRTARLNASEVALLETLEAWDRVIEVPMSEAWDRLGGLLTDGTMRSERLCTAARTEPGSVRTRLAALLTDAGLPEFAISVPTADARTAKGALVGVPVGR